MVSTYYILQQKQQQIWMKNAIIQRQGNLITLTLHCAGQNATKKKKFFINMW